MRNLRELLDNMDYQNNIVYINNITINNNYNDNLLNNNLGESRRPQNNRSDNRTNNRNNHYDMNNNRNNNDLNNNRNNNDMNNNRNNNRNNDNDINDNRNNNNNINDNRNNNNDNNNRTNNRTNDNNNSNMNLIEIEPILASATLNLDDIQQDNLDSLSSIISEELTNLANSFNSPLFNDRLRSGRRIVMTRELNIPRNTVNQEARTQFPVPLLSLNSKTELIVITNENKFIYNENCSICSLPIVENNIIRKIINCNHYFHQNCVDIWFSTNSTCPICRTNLLEDNIEQNHENVFNNNNLDNISINNTNNSDSEED